MVTAEQVWSAFGEIPDPEIPVVSLVDLGVIRSVDVHEGHVRVEFTPTFLGCPALEAMKRALEEKVGDLGATPEVQVVQDDSWSTDKITPAGREKLRAAGFAPPAPREAVEGDAVVRSVLDDPHPAALAVVRRRTRVVVARTAVVAIACDEHGAFE